MNELWLFVNVRRSKVWNFVGCWIWTISKWITSRALWPVSYQNLYNFFRSMYVYMFMVETSWNFDFFLSRARILFFILWFTQKEVFFNMFKRFFFNFRFVFHLLLKRKIHFIFVLKKKIVKIIFFIQTPKKRVPLVKKKS